MDTTPVRRSAAQASQYGPTHTGERTVVGGDRPGNSLKPTLQTSQNVHFKMGALHVMAVSDLFSRQVPVT